MNHRFRHHGTATRWVLQDKEKYVKNRSSSHSISVTHRTFFNGAYTLLRFSLTIVILDFFNFHFELLSKWYCYHDKNTNWVILSNIYVTQWAQQKTMIIVNLSKKRKQINFEQRAWLMYKSPLYYGALCKILKGKKMIKTKTKIYLIFSFSHRHKKDTLKKKTH